MANKGIPTHHYPAHADSSWQDLAACRNNRNPELFFNPDCYRAALAICKTGPVTEPCRQSRPVGAGGVWGGHVYAPHKRIVSHTQEYLRDEHGTPAAARRHQRKGEKPCQRCLAAQDNRRHPKDHR